MEALVAQEVKVEATRYQGHVEGEVGDPEETDLGDVTASRRRRKNRVTGEAYDRSRMITRVRLFASSYAPLFVALAIKFDNSRLASVLVGVAVVSSVSLWMLLRTSSHTAPRAVTPTACRDMGGEVSAYVATYIIPFVTIGNPDARDLVAYGVVFATLCVVYINSDLVGVNPLLYLFRYRVFAVEGIRLDRDGVARECLVVSRRRPVAGAAIEVVDINDDLRIATR